MILELPGGEREEKMMDLRKGVSSLRPETTQETPAFGKQEMAQIIREQKSPEVKKVAKGGRSVKSGKFALQIRQRKQLRKGS